MYNILHLKKSKLSKKIIIVKSKVILFHGPYFQWEKEVHFKKNWNWNHENIFLFSESCQDWDLKVARREIDETIDHCLLEFYIDCKEEIYPIPSTEDEETYFIVTSEAYGEPLENREVLASADFNMKQGTTNNDRYPDTVQVVAQGSMPYNFDTPRGLVVNLAAKGGPSDAKREPGSESLSKIHRKA